jgi:hypothetical protein
MVSSSSDSEPDAAMRYGVIGDDDTSLPDKLDKYVGEVSWSYLLPHFKTGSLLFIATNLDIKTVGEALSQDDVEAVKAWRKSGDLLNPSQPHADYWADQEFTFRALVVSPFVLMQQVEP